MFSFLRSTKSLLKEKAGLQEETKQLEAAMRRLSSFPQFMVHNNVRCHKRIAEINFILNERGEK